jgi:hypothetical protein
VHELVVVDLDPAIAVRVELLERLAELLDGDACANEAVERDAGRAATLTRNAETRRGALCGDTRSCEIYQSCQRQYGGVS